MADISFPQKSKFGTVTANKLVCPEIDTVGVDLQIRRDGGGVLSAYADRTMFWQSIRLATDKGLQDNSGLFLIAGDNVGNIDQLARLDAPLTFPDYALRRQIPIWQSRITGGAVRDTVKLRSSVSETIMLLVQRENLVRLYGVDLLCAGFTFWVGTTSANDKIDEMRFGAWDHVLDGFTALKTDPTDRADGGAPATWDWIFPAAQDLTFGVYALEIDTVIATANIDINGITMHYVSA